jgi:hypothetical protein
VWPAAPRSSLAHSSAAPSRQRPPERPTCSLCVPCLEEVAAVRPLLAAPSTTSRSR